MPKTNGTADLSKYLLKSVAKELYYNKQESDGKYALKGEVGETASYEYQDLKDEEGNFVLENGTWAIDKIKKSGYYYGGVYDDGDNGLWSYYYVAHFHPTDPLKDIIITYNVYYSSDINKWSNRHHAIEISRRVGASQKFTVTSYVPSKGNIEAVKFNIENMYKAYVKAYSYSKEESDGKYALKGEGGGTLDPANYYDKNWIDSEHAKFRNTLMNHTDELGKTMTREFFDSEIVKYLSIHDFNIKYKELEGKIPSTLTENVYSATHPESVHVDGVNHKKVTVIGKNVFPDLKCFNLGTAAINKNVSLFSLPAAARPNTVRYVNGTLGNFSSGAFSSVVVKIDTSGAVMLMSGKDFQVGDFLIVTERYSLDYIN